MTMSDIETKAFEVVNVACKETSQRLFVTPVFEFVEHLKDKHNVKFSLGVGLGFDNTGRKILGVFKRQRPYEILIDSKVIHDHNRLKFTISHELGHLALHRHLALPEEDYNIYEEPEFNTILQRKEFTCSRHWVEWQANYFAGAFLVPKIRLYRALLEIQNEIGVKRNLGKIYVTSERSSYKDLNRVIDELSKRFCVSEGLIITRLRQLKLYFDSHNRNIVRKLSSFEVSEIKKC